jgi:hypothetical protein
MKLFFLSAGSCSGRQVQWSKRNAAHQGQQTLPPVLSFYQVPRVITRWCWPSEKHSVGMAPVPRMLVLPKTTSKMVPRKAHVVLESMELEILSCSLKKDGCFVPQIELFVLLR